jgi:hypothetical protein
MKGAEEWVEGVSISSREARHPFVELAFGRLAHARRLLPRELAVAARGARVTARRSGLTTVIRYVAAVHLVAPYAEQGGDEETGLDLGPVGADQLEHRFVLEEY